MTLELKVADGGVVKVSPEILSTFKAGFAGPVLGSDEAAFDETPQGWSAMSNCRPGLILRCSGTADIVHAVRFARQHQFLLSVRGGHTIEGQAECEGGLMIDLSLMKGVWVDPVARTARAQPGCTQGKLDRETQLHGLAAVLGFVSATGIAGVTLGGGFGFLTRQYGWTCDNLVSMEVLTAEGRLLRAAADENADLFWALRGGGGNFGIVTSFEYRLFPVGPEILGGAIAWRAEDATDVLDFFRRFTATAPRETTCVAVLGLAPPAPWLPGELHGQAIVAVYVCHRGSLEAGEAILAPLRNFGRPVADNVTRRPYTQMQRLLDATQPKGRRNYWRSHYLAQIEPQAIDVLVAHAARLVSPHPAIVLFHLQGALGELPAEHSPAGNRDAAFVLNITSAWEHPTDDAANLRWARDCFEATQGFSTCGSRVNILTDEQGCQGVEAACGESIPARLAALKKKYDPDHLFRPTRNITA